MRLPFVRLLLLACGLAGAPFCSGLDNGASPTPYLGWSSWNAFGDISTHDPPIGAAALLEIADTIVSSGLRDAGYVNFNVDAGWAHDGHFFGRGSNGTLVPNPRLFPDGMKAFCDALHSRGLKCGLYTGYGPMVCGFMNGSWGYEEVDATTFASWGVDLLKNDWCYNNGGAIEDAAPAAFSKMRDALNRTGRQIIYAIHGKGGPGTAWPTYYEDSPVIANSWRMGGDIEQPMKPSWTKILGLIDSETADNTTAGVSGPNAWNDLDMMVVGQGLSPTEDRAQISQWAMMASPMIIGTDLRNARLATARLIADLSHPGILAISQDALGRQATLVPSRYPPTPPPPQRPGAVDGRLQSDLEAKRQQPPSPPPVSPLQVWHRPLSNGDVAVSLLNRGDKPANISFGFAEVGIEASSQVEVKNIWAGGSAVTVDASKRFEFEVISHSAEVFRLKGL